MHKKEPDDLGLLVGTLRVMLSLAVMATGFLLLVAVVGQIDHLERLLALGFLTIAFRQILGLLFFIQMTLTFTSSTTHELEHKRNS